MSAPHVTPCESFKAFRIYAIAVFSLMGIMAIYIWGRLDSLSDRAVERDKLLAGLNTDMKYVREDLSTIKHQMSAFPNSPPTLRNP